MDSNLLKGAIVSKGMTQESLAKSIGINPATFYRKVSGESEFTLSEIVNICKVLCVDPVPIFFAKELT